MPPREAQRKNRQREQEESTDDLLRNAEQEKLRATEEALFALHQILIELNIPYRLIGSTALAIYKKQEGEKVETQPDDIDIALKTHGDLLKILKYANDTSPQNIRIEEPHRIGERALMAKGTYTVGNHEIPFEFMADTEIVPNNAWEENRTIQGISVLAPQYLKEQYGNVAKIETRAKNHAQRIYAWITKHIGEGDTLQAKSDKAARIIIKLFPDTSQELQAQLGSAIVQAQQGNAVQIILEMMGRKAKDRSENLRALQIPS